VGDFIVLVNAGFSRAKALLYNALSGLAAVARRGAGLLRGRPVAGAVPVPAGGGDLPAAFIYVAVADLMPLAAAPAVMARHWVRAGLLALRAGIGPAA
jgi:zinc and cadmium transporter